MLAKSTQNHKDVSSLSKNKSHKKTSAAVRFNKRWMGCCLFLLIVLSYICRVRKEIGKRIKKNTNKENYEFKT